MVKTDKRIPSQLPLDPKLPANFDDTPNSERSKEQLDEWWDHPYGITKPDGSFTDRCLNGGARDRSSVLGKVRTYEEACLLAHDAQAKWVNTRLKPIFMYSNEPPFRLVVQSQRPDYEESIIGEFNTIDEINLFLLKQHPTRTTWITSDHRHKTHWSWGPGLVWERAWSRCLQTKGWAYGHFCFAWGGQYGRS